MRVLVACEFSGIVRDAFIARGHDAVSCDLLPTERPGPHITGDVRAVLHDGWDMMIGHPVCTRLCRAGERWLHVPPPRRTHGELWREFDEGVMLFLDLWNAPIDMIALENPRMNSFARKAIPLRPHHTIHPWEYGHGETKETMLWLKQLPPLMPTNIVSGRVGRVHKEPPGPDRWKRRSEFYSGWADAMAEQWGGSQ